MDLYQQPALASGAGAAAVRLADPTGQATLDKLRQGNVLDPAQRIKVSRSEVKGMILRSLAVYGWPPAWRKLFP